MSQLPRPSFPVQVPGRDYAVTMDNIGTIDDLARVEYTMPVDGSDHRHYLRRANDGTQTLVPGFDYPTGLNDPSHFLNEARRGVDLPPGVRYMTTPRNRPSAFPTVPAAPRRVRPARVPSLLSRALAITADARQRATTDLTTSGFRLADNPEAAILMYEFDSRLPKLSLDDAWTLVNYDPSFVSLIPHSLANIHMYIVALMADPSLMGMLLELVSRFDRGTLEIAYRDRTGCVYYG